MDCRVHFDPSLSSLLHNSFVAFDFHRVRNLVYLETVFDALC